MEGLTVTVGLVLVALTAFACFFIICFKKTPLGCVGIRTGFGRFKIARDWILCVPLLQRIDFMDITVQSLVLRRTGKDGLACADYVRANVRVVFFLQPDLSDKSINHVAQHHGHERIASAKYLIQLFETKF